MTHSHADSDCSVRTPGLFINNLNITSYVEIVNQKKRYFSLHKPLILLNRSVEASLFSSFTYPKMPTECMLAQEDAHQWIISFEQYDSSIMGTCNIFGNFHFALFLIESQIPLLTFSTEEQQSQTSAPTLPKVKMSSCC